VAGSAVGCSIAPVTAVPANFSYQTTNPATNQVTGSPNTPVDIGPGAAQTFVVAFTPTSAFATNQMRFTFSCANAGAAAVIPGVNTLDLTACGDPVADIVALAVTPTADGIANIPPAGGVFAVGAVNVGASASGPSCDGNGQFQVGTLHDASTVVTVCRTDQSGQCQAPPSNQLVTTIPAGQTASFGVFLQASGPVAFDPANTRVTVRFREVSTNIFSGPGPTRGSTSVAVRTTP
jgi:hypothetical protein